SEIVAGALQDHDRAVIVGRTSYGKGSAQSLYPIKSGGALKLTTARWYTPAGRSIDRLHKKSDQAPLADADKAEDRPRFKTDDGRTVLGGGGITPDVVVGDSAFSPKDLALQSALNNRIPQFRDALTAYAIAQKTAGIIHSTDFVVTPAMLDELWATMQARGIQFDRSVYDAASPLVSRLLGREIARFVFDASVEAQRSIHDDEVIQYASSLAAGATSQSELLRRAAERKK
ncbi:MAG: S41 family peptidase, partial [Gemmatimonadaceae bacterium]